MCIRDRYRRNSKFRKNRKSNKNFPCYVRRFYYSILERKITKTALDGQDYNQRELRSQSKQSVSKERQVSVCVSEIRFHHLQKRESEKILLTWMKQKLWT